MNRDGIAEPRFPSPPTAPGRDEAHIWRIALPAQEARAVARRALREILGAYLGIEPNSVELSVESGGKPRAEGISFNLSHSGGLALVAVAAAGNEIGVDVERVRSRRDPVRLARRWLPAEDAETVAAADAADTERVFYEAWTRYEARTKCAGTGISGPPPGPEIVAEPLEIDRGYAAALATDQGARIFVRRFDFSD